MISVILHLAFHAQDLAIDAPIHPPCQPIQQPAPGRLNLVFERQLHFREMIANRQQFHKAAQFHFPAARMKKHLLLIIRGQEFDFKRTPKTAQGLRTPMAPPICKTGRAIRVAQVPKSMENALGIRKARLDFVEGLSEVENFLNKHLGRVDGG